MSVDKQSYFQRNLGNLLAILETNTDLHYICNQLRQISEKEGGSKKNRKMSDDENYVRERRKRVLDECKKLNLKIWKILVCKSAELRNREISICEYLLSELEQQQEEEEVDGPIRRRRGEVLQSALITSLLIAEANSTESLDEQDE
jgi:uroporphyrinogen-III decarboxylase